MPRIDKVNLDAAKLVRAAVMKELTRRELADAAGLTHSTVTRAFAGLPTGLKSARAIARALGSSIVKLMAPDGAAVTAA